MFRFVKSSGAADSSVTCTVREGGETKLTLGLESAGIWTGTLTASSGSHTYTLTASDGANSVVMSVVPLIVAGRDLGSFLNMRTLIMTMGIAVLGIGGLSVARDKKLL